MRPAACTTSAAAPETAAVTVAAAAPLRKVPRLMVGLSVDACVTALSPLIAGKPVHSCPRLRRGAVLPTQLLAFPLSPPCRTERLANVYDALEYHLSSAPSTSVYEKFRCRQMPGGARIALISLISRLRPARCQ